MEGVVDIAAKGSGLATCHVCSERFGSKYWNKGSADAKRANRLPIKSNACSHNMCFPCVEWSLIVASRGRRVMRSAVQCPFCNAGAAFATTGEVDVSMCQLSEIVEDLERSTSTKISSTNPAPPDAGSSNASAESAEALGTAKAAGGTSSSTNPAPPDAGSSNASAEPAAALGTANAAGGTSSATANCPPPAEQKPKPAAATDRTAKRPSHQLCVSKKKKTKKKAPVPSPAETVDLTLSDEHRPVRIRSKGLTITDEWNADHQRKLAAKEMVPDWDVLSRDDPAYVLRREEDTDAEPASASAAASVAQGGLDNSSSLHGGSVQREASLGSAPLKPFHTVGSVPGSVTTTEDHPSLESESSLSNPAHSQSVHDTPSFSRVDSGLQDPEASAGGFARGNATSEVLLSPVLDSMRWNRGASAVEAHEHSPEGREAVCAKENSHASGPVESGALSSSKSESDAVHQPTLGVDAFAPSSCVGDGLETNSTMSHHAPTKGDVESSDSSAYNDDDESSTDDDDLSSTDDDVLSMTTSSVSPRLSRPFSVSRKTPSSGLLFAQGRHHPVAQGLITAFRISFPEEPDNAPTSISTAGTTAAPNDERVSGLERTFSPTEAPPRSETSSSPPELPQSQAKPYIPEQSPPMLQISLNAAALVSSAVGLAAEKDSQSTGIPEPAQALHPDEKEMHQRSSAPQLPPQSRSAAFPAPSPPLEHLTGPSASLLLCDLKANSDPATAPKPDTSLMLAALGDGSSIPHASLRSSFSPVLGPDSVVATAASKAEEAGILAAMPPIVQATSPSEVPLSLKLPPSQPPVKEKSPPPSRPPSSGVRRASSLSESAAAPSSVQPSSALEPTKAPEIDEEQPHEPAAPPQKPAAAEQTSPRLSPLSSPVRSMSFSPPEAPAASTHCGTDALDRAQSPALEGAALSRCAAKTPPPVFPPPPHHCLSLQPPSPLQSMPSSTLQLPQQPLPPPLTLSSGGEYHDSNETGRGFDDTCDGRRSQKEANANSADEEVASTAAASRSSGKRCRLTLSPYFDLLGSKRCKAQDDVSVIDLTWDDSSVDDDEVSVIDLTGDDDDDDEEEDIDAQKGY